MLKKTNYLALLNSSFMGRLKMLYRGKCFCVRNFIYAVTKDMCMSEEELTDIKARVHVTKESELKFNEWERVAPTIREGIEFLKSEAERLTQEKQFCMEGIREIYLADLAGNEDLKAELFARFGLPFIFENELKNNNR